MDFNRFGQNRPAIRNTTAQPAQPAAAAVGKSVDEEPAASVSAKAPKTDFKQSRGYRWSFLALLISGTVLVIATIFFIVYGRTMNREAHYVKADQYQAVFVNVNGTNGGQVYFGKVKDMTNQYIRLTDVFYIQNQTDDKGQSSGAYNLVKLGCELHGPNDEMLINRGEVFFWENLKNDSQVAQKAAEFHKQNPNGQKCSTNTGTTNQSGGTTQTPATGTQAPATGSQTPAAGGSSATTPQAGTGTGASTGTGTGTGTSTTPQTNTNR